MDAHTELFKEFEKQYWNITRNMSYLWREIFERQFPGSQSHLLILLERSGPKKMSELAESLHLTRGAISIASDKLVESGYLTRIQNNNDRRVIKLEITDKGKEIITQLQDEGRRAMKRVFSHLSQTDLQSFIDAFENASQNLNDIRKEYNT